MPANPTLLLAALVQLGILLWAAPFAINRFVPLREVLPLMALAGGNAAWMLVMGAGA